MGVQRLGVHAAPCRSKSGCPRCPQCEVESPTADNPSSLKRTLNQSFNAGNICIPGISLFRGGFPNGLYST